MVQHCFKTGAPFWNSKTVQHRFKMGQIPKWGTTYTQHRVDTVLAKAGPGDTVCQLCKKKLKTTQNLRAHIISKHMGTKSPFKCQVCDETFGSAYALKLHLRKHSASSKKYTCRVCDKVYFSIGHYNEHLKVHSGRQFICPWCAKIFQHKKNLNAHQQETCSK